MCVLYNRNWSLLEATMEQCGQEESLFYCMSSKVENGVLSVDLFSTDPKGENESTVTLSAPANRKNWNDIYRAAPILFNANNISLRMNNFIIRKFNGIFDMEEIQDGHQ